MIFRGKDPGLEKKKAKKYNYENYENTELGERSSETDERKFKSENNEASLYQQFKNTI